MLKKYMDWYRSVDEESLLVLKHPEMAEQVQGRVRRYVALQAAGPGAGARARVGRRNLMVCEERT